MKKKDWSGSTFGELYIKERIYRENTRAAYYRAICSCGKEIEIRASEFISGNRVRCSFISHGIPRIDKTNKKRGKLQIIQFAGFSYIGKNKRKVPKWQCKCECGKIKTILDSSRARSCGCISRKLKFASKDASWAAFYSRYKLNASRNSIEFNLSFDEFINLSTKNCIYCGISPYRLEPSKKPKSRDQLIVNGIDRIDSNNGYTINNCVTSCQICNYAKRDMDMKSWIDWLNRVSNFRNEIK